MAYEATPGYWLAGTTVSVDTDPITPTLGDVHIPIEILPEFDGGDGGTEIASFPNLLYAILQALYLKWFNTDVANRPVNWAVYKSVNPSATVEGESTVTFNIQFNTALATGAVNVKAL